MTGTLGLLSAENAAKTYVLRSCHAQVTIPARYILRQETPTVLLARAKTGEDLIVSCLPNAKMTSRHEDLAGDLRKEGDEIWSEEIVKVGPLTGIAYLRRGLEMGKPIERAEGYVAARNFELRVSLLYPSGNPQAMERLDDVRSILGKTTFTSPVEPTITESGFRTRLFALIGLLVLFLSGVTFLLVRRQKIRAQKAVAKKSPAPETPT